jgi:hypothetical protein
MHGVDLPSIMWTTVERSPRSTKPTHPCTITILRRLPLPLPRQLTPNTTSSQAVLTPPETSNNERTVPVLHPLRIPTLHLFLMRLHPWSLQLHSQYTVHMPLSPHLSLSRRPVARPWCRRTAPSRSIATQTR